MKTFQDIEIAREMQNMIGHPQRVIKPWQYQFTREDFYHPDEVRGCRWAIRDETKPKEPAELDNADRPGGDVYAADLRLCRQDPAGDRRAAGNCRTSCRSRLGWDLLWLGGGGSP